MMLSKFKILTLFLFGLGNVGESSEQTVGTSTTGYEACCRLWCQRQPWLVLRGSCWRKNEVISDGKYLLVALIDVCDAILREVVRRRNEIVRRTVVRSLRISDWVLIT